MSRCPTPVHGRGQRSRRGIAHHAVPVLRHQGAATDAVASFDLQRFSDGLDKALAETSSGPERTHVLLDYAVGYINDHPARELTESEPGFVIAYLRAMQPAVEAMLLGHLGEELTSAPPVVAGTLSAEQVLDVIMRLLTTGWVLPGRDRSHLVATMDWLLHGPSPAG